MGLMAGPESPAVMLAMRGRRVLASMAMARKVLTRETASAPACSATEAISAMEVTLGESLTMIGRAALRDLARCKPLACCVDERGELDHVGAEGLASVFGVGAGGVDLVGGDAFGVVEAFDDSDVVLDLA